MQNVELALIVTTFVCCVMYASKARPPLWVAVLLLTIAVALEHLPR